ncbi:serine/arginine repetitive matrix protein 2 isoform X2 [Drosophila guanche]|uniref:serine/arginine repetitive matrix protein 2 isoform X2 n=1 Tax=Drosophila guanche TaxID=7266 RepID=UPI0014708C4D|nr:serine/arginine repetitive matrix protein 2 isoform X2 [Drosophila guanche]
MAANLNLSWTQSHQPRLGGGSNECRRECYECRQGCNDCHQGRKFHRSPQFQPQSENNYYTSQYTANVACPYHKKAPDMGLGPALLGPPHAENYVMDDDMSGSSERDKLRPCSCYKYTQQMETVAPETAETQDVEEYDPSELQPSEVTYAEEEGQDYDESENSDLFRQSRGTAEKMPSKEIESGTGIRSRDCHDPRYYDPVNCRATGQKKKRKVTKTIYMPAPTSLQKCQCATKAAEQGISSRKSSPCSDCLRCLRCRSRTRDNLPPPAVARSRHPFAVYSQRSDRSCSCPARERSAFEKYEKNWAKPRHTSSKRSKRKGKQRYTERDEDYIEIAGHRDDTIPWKYLARDSNETMVERQEQIHRYSCAENETCKRMSKERGRTYPSCGMGCLPAKSRGCIRLICRLQPKRPTAGSAAKGKLLILPDAQTQRPTTIYRSMAAPVPIRRKRLATTSRKRSSHFPAVPRSCMLRVCYVSPDTRTQKLRCRGGRNGSAGELINPSRIRTRPTSVAEAPSLMPAQRRYVSAPSPTLAAAPHDASVHGHLIQGRSSPSRSQQPQPQARYSQQPQAQARYSQQPQAQAQAQARYSQQQRAYASPNHPESRVLNASANQALPGLVRPIPVHPRSELARTFPPRMAVPVKPQRLQTPGEEKPLPSRAQNPEATLNRPQNQAQSPTRPAQSPIRPQNQAQSPTRPAQSPIRPQNQAQSPTRPAQSPTRPQNPAQSSSRSQQREAGAARPPNPGRSPTRPPQQQEAANSRKPNDDRAESRPQQQEATGTMRPQTENRGGTRQQHQEAAGPARPPNDDRQQEPILSRNPKLSAARPPSVEQSERAAAEEPLPAARGPAAFYRGSFLRVRESQEHLNESSRGPVYRREPIGYLRANTRRGLVLNPDSQSLLATRAWPRILHSYQDYVFGGPNIKSPGSWSWRRLFGSYMKKRKSKI